MEATEYSLLRDEDENEDPARESTLISSSLQDVDEAQKMMLDMSVKEAGRWSYGVKAVEVWEYTKQGKLELVPGGHWVDAAYFQTNDLDIFSALEQLYDPNSPNFDEVDDEILAPGEGLAGVLWTESKRFSSKASALTSRAKKAIQWRNIRVFAEDPHQPYNKRVKLIAKAGFHYAAGLRFNVRGTRGVVVYMARESINMQKMQSILNEEFMLSATQHIGSVLAMSTPRRLSVQQRRIEARKTLKKAIILIRLFSIGKIELQDDEVKEENLGAELGSENDQSIDGTTILLETLGDKLVDIKEYWGTWASKMKGSNVMPPPGFSWQLFFFCLLVSFLTAFVLYSTSTLFKLQFGNGFGFELSQIGSLTSLLYTLTASPAAQPRTIMIGQLTGMMVGISFSLLPDFFQPDDSYTGNPGDSLIGWFNLAMAVAISSALMGLFGCAHPPGAALSVGFLYKKWNSRETYLKIFVVMFQDSLLILMAAILNNLLPEKAYPTYWGYIPNMIVQKIKALLNRADDDTKNIKKLKSRRHLRSSSLLTFGSQPSTYDDYHPPHRSIKEQLQANSLSFTERRSKSDFDPQNSNELEIQKSIMQRRSSLAMGEVYYRTSTRQSNHFGSKDESDEDSAD